MDKIKTCKEDFFEKFPDAPRTLSGKPKCCPMHCYSSATIMCMNYVDSCERCWNQPVPENKSTARTAGTVTDGKENINLHTDYTSV